MKKNIDVTKFINSIDYINKDISQINFEQYELNKKIINIEINLKPFIAELNNKLNNSNLYIQSEKELYE